MVTVAHVKTKAAVKSEVPPGVMLLVVQTNDEFVGLGHSQMGAKSLKWGAFVQTELKLLG